MQIKVDKLATIEGRQEAQYWSVLINNELACYDYIIFGKIQQLVVEVIEEAKKCGAYVKTTKMLLNQIKDDTNKLVTACKTSESLEMLDLVVSPFPNYRYDYMKGGGYFLTDVCYRWSKLTEEHFSKLHYSLRNCFLNMDVKNVDLLVKLYEVRVICQILDAICDVERKKLHAKTGINVKQMKVPRFESIEGKIKKVCSMLVDEHEISKRKEFSMIQLAGQIILNVTISEPTGEIIGDALINTIKDYSYYCLGRMLMDVRQNGRINDDDYNGLKEMGFVSSFVDKIVEELKKTHVGEKETDPHELKCVMPNIKYCKNMNVFVRAMASVTNDIKNIA